MDVSAELESTNNSNDSCAFRGKKTKSATVLVVIKKKKT